MILLEIRDTEVCYDILLQSLTEFYLTQKDILDLEIISIPIVQPSTRFNTVERFSKEVPWLVLRNPWTITRSMKHFLVQQCHWELEDEWISATTVS
jgi:hypothetical protein